MKADKQEIIKYAGWLGVALLAGGYLRYVVREEMGTFDKSLLIAGAVLVVLSLALNFRAVTGVFGRRSTKLGTNTAVLTVAVIAILAVINYLGYRHHKRLDLTSENLYSLSDQTRKIVSGLRQDVKIIKFDKVDDPGLREQIQDFKRLSGKISYERIDPQERRQLAEQYGVRSFGETIVTSGTRTEHLTATGEQDLVNAVLKVTRDKLKNVCFVESHNEKSTAASGAEGLSAVNGGLKNQNYETKTVDIVSAEVPKDCEVLVVAGPKKPLFSSEVENIGKYLDGGGKALLMIDADTDPQLGDLLKSWNIALGNDIVLDVSGVGRLFGLGAAAPIAREYGSHPITKDFNRAMTVLPSARSVKVADPSKTDVTTTELLKTSGASWAETDLKNPQAEFNEGKDTKGPVSLGVAASKRVGEKEARLVVIGDSDFASNQFVNQQANGDLFLNTINWLAQDEDLISIRPKSVTNRTISLTETQKNLIWLLTVIFLPAAVIFSGGYIWWKRR
ncbi:MAG TPA: Gldg family protein [Blastocatellia bacterium]|nr:Gldg family protein [Blastocatellia bacterium]